MFCSKCGIKIREGIGFCPKCGNRVDTNVKATYEPKVTFEYGKKKNKWVRVIVLAIATALLIFFGIHFISGIAQNGKNREITIAVERWVEASAETQQKYASKCAEYVKDSFSGSLYEISENIIPDKFQVVTDILVKDYLTDLWSRYFAEYNREEEIAELIRNYASYTVDSIEEQNEGFLVTITMKGLDIEKINDAIVGGCIEDVSDLYNTSLDIMDYCKEVYEITEDMVAGYADKLRDIAGDETFYKTYTGILVVKYDSEIKDYSVDTYDEELLNTCYGM